MAKLKAEKRNDLKDSDFGIPEKRMYPLNDEAHVKAAARMFGHASNEDKPALARKILRKAKEYGIDSSGWKQVNAWAHKDSDSKPKQEAYVPLSEFNHYFKNDFIEEEFDQIIDENNRLIQEGLFGFGRSNNPDNQNNQTQKPGLISQHQYISEGLKRAKNAKFDSDPRINDCISKFMQLINRDSEYINTYFNYLPTLKTKVQEIATRANNMKSINSYNQLQSIDINNNVQNSISHEIESKFINNNLMDPNDYHNHIDNITYNAISYLKSLVAFLSLAESIFKNKYITKEDLAKAYETYSNAYNSGSVTNINYDRELMVNSYVTQLNYMLKGINNYFNDLNNSLTNLAKSLNPFKKLKKQ